MENRYFTGWFKRLWAYLCDELLNSINSLTSSFAAHRSEVARNWDSFKSNKRLFCAKHNEKAMKIYEANLFALKQSYTIHI